MVRIVYTYKRNLRRLQERLPINFGILFSGRYAMDHNENSNLTFQISFRLCETHHRSFRARSFRIIKVSTITASMPVTKQYLSTLKPRLNSQNGRPCQVRGTFEKALAVEWALVKAAGFSSNRIRPKSMDVGMGRVAASTPV